MKPEVKNLWISALRSGEYQQGVGALRQKADPEQPDRFCCLGVLCDLAVKAGVIPEPELTIPGVGDGSTIGELFPGAAVVYRYGEPNAGYGGVSEIKSSTGYLPDKVVEWAGIIGGNSARLRSLDHEIAGYESLVGANDAGRGFKFIAKLIEDYL